mmetsp:Transcript_2827/g.3753  ORF Transcript_2827/g.3753 Transcript_2827/m.3753 type:complete len:1339 (-) Transcript_2827:16-4032(-)
MSEDQDSNSYSNNSSDEDNNHDRNISIEQITDSLNSSQERHRSNSYPIVEERSENADENEELLTISVHFEQYNGTAEPLELNIPPSTTVFDIKRHLAQEFEIMPHIQKLYWIKGNVESDVELEDEDKTLDDYSVVENEEGVARMVLLADDSTENSGENTPNSITSPPRAGIVTYGPTFITNHAISTSPTYNNLSDDDNYGYSWVSDKRPTIGLVGLKNQGATCYLNSLIQVLYLTPEFRRLIYRFVCPYEKLLAANDNDAKSKEKEKEADSKESESTILFQMQLLFARMQYSNVSSVSTSGLTTSFGWTNMDIFVQHDVQELNRVLCDKLEEKMKLPKDAVQSPFEFSIPGLYRGVMVNMVKCTACSRVSTREEDFYDVSLTIKGKKTIMESLDEFTEIEVMKDDNAYYCEGCQSKQTAHRSIRFKYLPPILNIQLKRFEYDWEKDIRVKLNDEIKFPNWLEMKNYMIGDDVAKQLQSTKDMDQIEAPQIVYELYGILVHSGSAGFGHYYAYIKNFTDAKWYKFNDEQVTLVATADNDITSYLSSFQNQPQTTGYSWMNVQSSIQRSATPYMLVYRRRLPPSPQEIIAHYGQQTSKTNEADGNQMDTTSDSMDTATSEMNSNVPQRFDLPLPSEWPMQNASQLKDFQIPPVEDREIPEAILNYLADEQKRKEQKKAEKMKEANSCLITVYRNRVECKPVELKVEKTTTLEQLRAQVVATVSQESGSNNCFFRFRRSANRKNNTKRCTPQVYQADDYQKTLEQLGLDKKPWLYLEQSTDPNFPGLGTVDTPEDHCFISIRLWSHELKQPTTVGDFIFHKSTTLGQLKQYFSPIVNLPVEQMVFVEEETDDIFNIMQAENDSLAKYSIVTGDILHIEPLVQQHFKQAEPNSEDEEAVPIPEVSFIQKYFEDKANEMVLTVEESQDSFKKRQEKMKAIAEGLATAAPEFDLNPPSIQDATNWQTRQFQFNIVSSKVATFGSLKTLISERIGVDPRAFRVYAKDSAGFVGPVVVSGMGPQAYFHDGRLLKDQNAKLADLLIRFNGARVTTDLIVHFLDHKEDLRKGDKLINTRYHNAKGDFVTMFEMVINKEETIRDLKSKLKEKTGIPEDNQIISEWYNEHYFKLFPNEYETIGQARIRKTDILRMDEISDPTLNISIAGCVAFQLVQYIAWDVTPYGKKEMQTTFPSIFTISENATLYDLRIALANRVGIPYQHINLATAQSFPIYEGSIVPIRDQTNRHAEREIARPVETESESPAAATSEAQSEDPDDIANAEAAKFNREGRTFNFKAERTVQLKKLRCRQLEILCWEDMRNPKADKPEGKLNPRVKRTHDADVLRIK